MNNLCSKLAVGLASAWLMVFAVPVAAQNDLGGLSDVVSVELLQGWRNADGTHMAAARISMAPGWKTYWRAPGASGIPPQFDWQGSTNVDSVKIYWPAPKVYLQNGLRSVGYKDVLVLPLELTPTDAGKDITVDTVLDFGVCEVICLPVRTRLQTVLPATGASDRKAILAALASQPVSGVRAGVTSVTCKFDPIEDGFRMTATIRLKARAGRKAFTVFEFDDPEVWIKEATTKVSGKRMTATADLVRFGEGAFAIDRSRLRLTVLAKNQTFEISGCPAA
jgi:DsbC/DsbD-like thiol-disulfide interchange protein